MNLPLRLPLYVCLLLHPHADLDMLITTCLGTVMAVMHFPELLKHFTVVIYIQEIPVFDKLIWHVSGPVENVPVYFTKISWC